MIQITKVQDNITSSLARISNDLTTLAPGAYKEWAANTPVKSGNARRKTRLERGSRSGTDVINANYNYAVPLDRGISKQAPQGMSKPTESWLKRQLSRIMRK